MPGVFRIPDFHEFGSDAPRPAAEVLAEREELERRASALQAAQSQLDQARAQGAVQGNQAGYSTLTATAAGVITAVEAEVVALEAEVVAEVADEVAVEAVAEAADEAQA